ncbi:protein-export membrane protein SecD [Thermoactinomyces sp. DSM 45891]|uniref:protein translocase subunit SecD n=1 Tax=Thermoactinomyces sp. DSM 45891 TaxID=1761907 RepID=UPI000911206F|nr:protein translocase subunit SecD [Thermoactinomyces sp. DSM 45891]SFX08464.1 protein-export membrane protein SecD [Thermoactinomyces sp. DSM 45891]
MKVKKGKVTIFIIIVVAILALAGTTALPVWNKITKGLDLQGGFEVLYEAPKDQKVDKAILLDVANALERRINVLGVSEPEISIEGNNRIRVQLAGVKDPAKARELLGKQAELTFREPTGKTAVIKGADLKPGSAKLSFDEYNSPVVAIEFKDGKKFEEITKKYIGQPLPIYLDEKELSSPVIQTVISGGKATISGQKTPEEAKELASLLNAGALPIKLQEVQSFAVDASLGHQSMRDTLIAGGLSVLMIFIFVIGFYRLPGLVAVMTLIAYTYLNLVIFAFLKVTLTLPGIAAFILGIGMAVDANIIMSERIREELRVGRTVKSALKAGSKRSFLTIFDANFTTILAGGVLFAFGTAGVKGFSVALIVGILCSFVTAVGLSRWLMSLLVNSNLVKNPVLFRVKEDEIGEL